jgi:hypothetical protein
MKTSVMIVVMVGVVDNMKAREEKVTKHHGVPMLHLRRLCLHLQTP